MAGSMRVRAKEKDGVVTVKALITHPMETGLRKDGDGNIIPAHFIQEVTATVGGEVVFTANWGTGVAKNPYLSFKYKGSKGDLLTCLLYTSPSPRDRTRSRMPSSA